MQSLWSAHRRGKVNLNSPVPTTPTIPTSSTEEPTLSQSTPTAFIQSDGDPALAVVQQDEATASASAPLSEVRSVKRKTRTRTAGEETSKRPKLSSIAKEYTPPSTRLSDLGGVTDAVEKMLELVAMPLCHPEVYLHTGVQPPRGVLLHGPPGCGKTLLANAIAGVSTLFITITDALLIFAGRNSAFPLSTYLPLPLFLECPGNPRKRCGTRSTKPRCG